MYIKALVKKEFVWDFMQIRIAEMIQCILLFGGVDSSILSACSVLLPNKSFD